MTERKKSLSAFFSVVAFTTVFFLTFYAFMFPLGWAFTRIGVWFNIAFLKRWGFHIGGIISCGILWLITWLIVWLIRRKEARHIAVQQSLEKKPEDGKFHHEKPPTR